MRSFLTILFFTTFLSSAQEYDFRYFGLKDGLTQVSIKCLYEDSRGLLWLGTSGGGLLSYNGHDFHSYMKEGEFEDGIIQNITEDEEGNIIVMSYSHDLFRYNGSGFEKIKYANKQMAENHQVTCFAKKGESLLLGLTGGIGIIKENKIEVLPIKDFPQKIVTHICFDSIQNRIIASLDKGDVLSVSLSGLSIDKQYSIRGDVTDLAVDSGDVLIATSSGLYVLDDQLQYTGVNLAVNFVYTCKNGEIWTGNKDLISYSEDKTVKISELKGLTTNSISSIVEDKFGNLWIGTIDRGLVLWIRNGFRYYPLAEAMNRNDIYSIVKYQDKIYTLSATNGIGYFDPKTQQSEIYRHNDEDIRFYTMTLYRDQLLVGSSAGILKFKEGKYINVNKEFGIEEPYKIRSFFNEDDERLWIGTAGRGLKTYPQIEDMDIFNQMRYDYIYQIYKDKEGSYWIGTGNGVYRYDTNAVTLRYYLNELCNSYSGSIIEDKFGRIWVGTDKCITIISRDSVFQLNTENGLNSNTIYLIGQDKNGVVYAGTNLGLNRISLNEDGEISSIRHQGSLEGFLGVECNSRAVLQDGNYMYFGTVGGINALNIDAVRYKYVPPSPEIMDILLFLKKENLMNYSQGKVNWFGIPETIQLPYDKNHISFKFGSVHIAPSLHNYQYKLSPFDKEWSPFSSNRQAVYANLPSGEYYLQIRVKTEGVKNVVTKKFGPIIINAPPPPPPPYYTRWWFYLLIGLPIFLIIFYFTVIRTSQFRKTQEELSRQVEERTAEIRKKNDEKEVLLKEVHHRVKNNLQIIMSLLSLQSQHIKDEEALEAFEESKNRIRSMSLIHERLYQTSDFAHIKFKTYVEELAGNLIISYATDKNIELMINIPEEAVFKMDILVPLGIVLNELISNAMKYAFPDNTKPKLEIILKELKGGKYKLSVADNGIGIRKDVDWTSTESLGMQLIQILADQINGRIEKVDFKGTRFDLTFPGEIV